MVDVGRREDRLLDKIAELISKRDNTIRTCEAFKESAPKELGEVMDFILVGLK